MCVFTYIIYVAHTHIAFSLLTNDKPTAKFETTTVHYFYDGVALFRGIQGYIALDANNITFVFDSGYIVNISGNIFLYPPRGHPILYRYVLRIYSWLYASLILCMFVVY